MNVWGFSFQDRKLSLANFAKRYSYNANKYSPEIILNLSFGCFTLRVAPLDNFLPSSLCTFSYVVM